MFTQLQTQITGDNIQGLDGDIGNTTINFLESQALSMCSADATKTMCIEWRNEVRQDLGNRKNNHN